jgi:inositol transport system substrate-binding protein
MRKMVRYARSAFASGLGTVVLMWAMLSSHSVIAEEKSDRLVIGVSMNDIDAYLSLLVKGLERSAEAANVELIIKNAQLDYETQRQDVADFLEAKVDALIVAPVIMDSTVSFSSDADLAGIPLVYVNSVPININLLPRSQTYVGSYEWDAGAFQADLACGLTEGKADVVVMTGQLFHNAALLRTKAVNDVFTEPRCSDMKIVAEATAEWSREKGKALVEQWLSSGLKFKVIIANNDEMALGAIDALKATNGSTEGYIIMGVDATQDALDAMKAGDLEATIFQDAKQQAERAIQASLTLINGETIDHLIYVPFGIVTQGNLETFAKQQQSD